MRSLSYHSSKLEDFPCRLGKMQILHKIILPFHSKIFFILKIYDFRVILKKTEKMGKITEIYFIENQRFGMFQTQCYSEERRPLSSNERKCY